MKCGFRCTPGSGHHLLARSRPPSATTGLLRRSKRALFDHLVCAGKHIWRHREAKSLGGFQIDHQRKPCRLLDWKVSRLFAFENTVGVTGRLLKLFDNVDSVGRQTAIHSKEPETIDRRYQISGCEFYDQLASC